jgi:hypothetical protein
MKLLSPALTPVTTARKTIRFHPPPLPFWSNKFRYLLQDGNYRATLKLIMWEVYGI